MKDIVAALMWIPSILVRWFFIALGLVFCPASLLGDGVKRTPAMWRFFADVETKPEWWDEDEVEWWSYAYIPLMGFLAWLSYGNWEPWWNHELVTIWLIFCTFFASLCATSKDRWLKFWWFGIRNPTIGFTKLFEQPVLEPRPNPDDLVYGGVQKSAHRWMRIDIFAEYWYLRAVGKKKFEFRIGWKFADGTPGFVPTIQMRLGE